tara:strand:- start:1760 stop:2440 length:681 start_codon:yes stop_codon:yes gene_type:complete
MTAVEDTPAIFTPEYSRVARAFIDFVNVQVGAYMDACSGFAKNKSVVERQVHRDVRPDGTKRGTKDAPRVMMTAVEDPTQPYVLMHRIVLVSEYIAANAVGGSNEQHHARAAITFLYAYWDEEVRPELGRALGVATNEIVSDIFGDLRLIRHAVLHNKGVLTDAAFRKLKLIGDHFTPDGAVSLPNATMHRIFVLIKQDMAQRVIIDSGLQGDGTDDIIEVATQRI